MRQEQCGDRAWGITPFLALVSAAFPEGIPQLAHDAKRCKPEARAEKTNTQGVDSFCRRGILKLYVH